MKIKTDVRNPAKTTDKPKKVNVLPFLRRFWVFGQLFFYETEVWPWMENSAKATREIPTSLVRRATPYSEKKRTQHSRMIEKFLPKPLILEFRVIIIVKFRGCRRSPTTKSEFKRSIV